MSFPVWPDGAAALEEALLRQWKEEGLFRRTLEQNASGEPFVFFEGPPTANGRPGIHHVFARTIKDLVCRFRAMQGRSVTRIAGWDTHGLPVEIEIEKELQLAGKRDIEQFGVAEFNERARRSVFRYQSATMSVPSGLSEGTSSVITLSRICFTSGVFCEVSLKASSVAVNVPPTSVEWMLHVMTTTVLPVLTNSLIADSL